ncbi:bifunctional glycosyltransferase/CDP-glycerol:glycerophosphate glycerophosphotransferase [Streptomyces sp. NBC_01304]|uniref:bifunctional glycosyltransferase/CDP-glycerol:glycerophosphate glycerophosphotransferase n=1 Tax=Streptomyces sp. NBC_01304 TaxID=2903818 RepID=UPI002E0E6E59|nr:bifunctional glycosyltransferase family 2 protein/CDP-glycerol:glycerophosphate glycerophosphotransferase [Streptomyces sp. NBC_01304]
MPRFSIVVPVFKVQGYLRACLDSVLDQSFTDIELIAVDDCSPDHCGDILDEYAARDPRVTAVHLPENVGLGRARNAGLDLATGDYVLFLDSDDSYTPGLLRAVDDRLRTTDDPDLLVFDHVRTFWWGRANRGTTSELLAQIGTGTFRIEDDPAYIHLFLVAWNKAFRRDFFLKQGFRFAPGLYEDAPVSYLAMITAERIGCLDRVGVEYRQRRQGAITRTPGRKHFDIFTQYEGLFAFLDGRPEFEWARPLLFERALDHMLFVLACDERVAPADRKEFHRETARFYRSHVPRGFTPPRGPRRTEFRLLSALPYAAYATHRRLRAMAPATRAHTEKLTKRLHHMVKQAWYKAQLMRRLDPRLAVYAAGHHRGVFGDPAAIHARAGQLAPHIKGVWVVQADAVDQVPPGTDYVLAGSWSHYAVMARATYWINQFNWAGNLVKRRGTTHIQTHQGTPLKYMGLDLLDRPAGRHGFNLRAMLRRSDRWDVSLAASRYAEEVWQRAYPCHFTSLRTGSPRNDVLVRGDAGRAATTRERLGIPATDTVVLYAPTRRDYRAGGHVQRVDPERLARALGPGHTLVVRLHPTLAGAPERDLELRDLHRAGLLVDATDEASVEDLMLASDALVTDYSALMFDYLCLDRPVVVHADDWDVYRVSRGAYFDITEDAPGHVTRTDEELAAVFSSGAWRDEESARRRAGFRERFCEYEDGRAAERVVRRVMLGEPDAALLPAARRDSENTGHTEHTGPAPRPAQSEHVPG